MRGSLTVCSNGGTGCCGSRLRGATRIKPATEAATAKAEATRAVCCSAGCAEARGEVSGALRARGVSAPGYSAASVTLRRAKAGFVCAEREKTTLRRAAGATAYARARSSAAVPIKKNVQVFRRVTPNGTTKRTTNSFLL